MARYLIRIVVLVFTSSLLAGCADYFTPGGVTFMGMGGGMMPMGGMGMGGMGMMGMPMGGFAYGGSWGHSAYVAPVGTLDNDPHYTTDYQNPMFKDDSNAGYYHPAGAGRGQS